MAGWNSPRAENISLADTAAAPAEGFFRHCTGALSTARTESRADDSTIPGKLGTATPDGSSTATATAGTATVTVRTIHDRSATKSTVSEISCGDTNGRPFFDQLIIVRAWAADSIQCILLIR